MAYNHGEVRLRRVKRRRRKKFDLSFGNQSTNEKSNSNQKTKKTSEKSLLFE
jgi:hypothetical protein